MLQRVPYFDLESFLFPTGYDVYGALTVTKDSFYIQLLAHFYFLGQSNVVLHAHNTFSREKMGQA
jgi:hypothetical protein